MSRPTRNETLEAVDALRQDRLRGHLPWKWNVAYEAARLYAGLAPDTCPTCNGKGHNQTVCCPTCLGRGYVWPDKLKQNLEWVLRANAPLMSQRMKDAIVAGLLDVLWEVTK